MLFYHEQLSLQAVANRLNISVGAVKGRLHKARHQLRDRLSLLQERIQPTSPQESTTMTSNTADRIQPEVCCSFCGKSQSQVNLLSAGPPVGNNLISICNECVDLCNRIIGGEKIPPLKQDEVEKLTDSDKLRG